MSLIRSNNLMTQTQFPFECESLSIKGNVMNSATQDPTEIPSEIEQLYEGQWIAWDTVTREVVGHGVTLDEAMNHSAEAFHAGHELYYHHVVPGDAVIVGGL